MTQNKCQHCGVDIPNSNFAVFMYECNNCWEIRHRISDIPFKVIQSIVNFVKPSDWRVVPND